MHRNDHPSAPGGIHTEGDPSRGIAPTTVTAAIMNALQEEIAHFIESRVIVLDKNDNTQLTQALLDAITTTVVGGDFVTHPEFEAHTQGGDPHQQYALDSMLGDAAHMDVGTTGGTVASGDHLHAQYELKTNLKQAAYRDVGSGADQVAAGNHAHAAGDVGAAPISHTHTAAQGNQDIVAGGYGQVGTGVQAWNSDGQSVFIGNTKPGSVLIPASSGGRRDDGHFLSGTYKCLGHSFGGGESDDATTQWIRIDAASLFEQQLMLSELGWDNAEHDSATAIATFADSGISLPFTAFKDDIEAHGRWLFAMIRDSEFGPVAEYVPPTALEVAARDNPKTRKQALADAIAQARHCEMMCDWDKAQEWRTYYQQLYTLEDAPEWPLVELWPAPPET